MTWNRVLAGRWLDAQVGSDVLIGAAAGAFIWVLFKGAVVVLLKVYEPTNWDVSMFPLLGTRHWIGSQALSLSEALRIGLYGFLTVFGLRRLLHNDLVAAVGTALVFTLQQGDVSNSREGLLIAAIFLVVYASLIFLLLRIGLVATIVAVFFVDGINGIVLGGDWRGWYIAPSLATFALLLAITAFAFWRSLGGRELIGGDDAA